MDIDRAVELEEEALNKQYDNGDIDVKEYNRFLRIIYSDARDAREEEALKAYDAVMDGH